MRTKARHSVAILLGTVLTIVTGCQVSGMPSDSPMGKSTTTRNSRDSVAKAPTKEQTLDVQLAFAQTLEQQGDHERAAAAYKKIMQQHPKCGEAVHRLAIIQDQANRFDESRPLFQKALKLQPGTPEIFCDLGYSQYLQRLWIQAEMNLRQAIAIQPEFKRAHNHLGLLLAQTDRRDEALAEFKRAGNTMVQAHMNCAVALLVNDRLAEARQEYEIALESGPLPEELEARMAQLGHVISISAGDSEPELEPELEPEPQIELTSGKRFTDERSGTVRVSDHHTTEPAELQEP